MKTTGWTRVIITERDSDSLHKGWQTFEIPRNKIGAGTVLRHNFYDDETWRWNFCDRVEEVTDENLVTSLFTLRAGEKSETFQLYNMFSGREIEVGYELA